MIKRNGQIGTGILTIIGLLFSASIGIAWQAFTKSDRAIEKTSTIEVDVAEIRTDVKWIRETLTGSKTITLASSSQLINGYR